MSIKRELKEVVTATCDFCGKEFEPSESYPRGRDGEYGVFCLALTFRIRDRVSGLSRVYGEDSPEMGYAEGHMCGTCFASISQKIGFNKAKGEN